MTLNKPRHYRTLMLVTLIFLMVGCSTTTAPKKEKNAVLDQAKAMVTAGQTDQALRLLESTMKSHQTDLSLSNYYRQVSVANKKFDDAISFFKEQVMDPNVANEMFFNLAFAYIDKIPTVGPMGSGFLSKRSIKQFRAVMDKEPENWIATYGVGMNYLHWPDYFKKNDNSVIFLEATLKLQQGKATRPYHILTYLRLGDAYVKTGDIDKAYQIWEQGLRIFKEHPDLVDRLDTPKSKIAKLIKDLYNPNNSIGEINTDISVLWEDDVPPSLVPLIKNPLKQAGVGGQLTGANAKIEKGQIGLFTWFLRNLPFLSDKSNYAKVDMSSLGISSNSKSHDLASIVAHGMIMGFLSQFEEESAQAARNRGVKLNAFQRPFFHEGIGMGYAATVSLDNVKELNTLAVKMKEIDENYLRLHLAGAGMWFGLESTYSLDKVKEAFAYLGPFGEAYAYEGYGFAKTLFYFKNDPTVLSLGKNLSEEDAHNYYHGAGRALWILSGEDVSALNKKMEQVPITYRDDALSGYGMGVAFTKIDDPKFVFSFLNRDVSQLNRIHFLTGVSMGYTIRNLAEPKYIPKVLTTLDGKTSCQVNLSLKVGVDSLSSVNTGGGDLHSDWRTKIQSGVKSNDSNHQWESCS